MNAGVSCCRTDICFILISDVVVAQDHSNDILCSHDSAPSSLERDPHDGSAGLASPPASVLSYSTLTGMASFYTVELVTFGDISR